MTSKYSVAFAKNLKELMGDMSLSEFARKVGIRKQTLSRYLNCESEVTVSYLCKIADYFNEDLDILLGRREY